MNVNEVWQRQMGAGCTSLAASAPPESGCYESPKTMAAGVMAELEMLEKDHAVLFSAIGSFIDAVDRVLVPAPPQNEGDAPPQPAKGCVVLNAIAACRDNVQRVAQHIRKTQARVNL
jgi:hypothetical protein